MNTTVNTTTHPCRVVFLSCMKHTRHAYKIKSVTKKNAVDYFTHIEVTAVPQ
jgi:hypothetical protein